MKLSLLLILTIFGCEPNKVTGKDSNVDCAGIVDGISLEDNCGVCDDDPTNDCEKDCAEVWGGSNICGCTDSTAYNFNSDASYDDGSCQSYLDQGDYYLGFNGSNSSVNVGDIMPQGSYTKAAWVKRKYGYLAKHNILSGNANHTFWIPQSQGARLSAGHQGEYSIVQDTDSIPEHIWTFVSVTYDAGSGTMTLYKNSEQVDLSLIHI